MDKAAPAEEGGPSSTHTLALLHGLHDICSAQKSVNYRGSRGRRDEFCWSQGRGCTEGPHRGEPELWMLGEWWVMGLVAPGSTVLSGEHLEVGGGGGQC